MSAAPIWLRRVALGLLAFVLLFAMLTVRVVVEGEAELKRSDQAFDTGDLREAILYARRAAVLYAPGAPHVGAAYARLSAIAIGAESAAEPEVARQAWGAVRGAALETRHLVTPRQGDLARANANLARLAAAPSGAGPERARLADLLARDESPRAPWVLLLGAGFGLFGGGLLLLAWRGVSAEGRLSRPGVVFALLVALAGAACWTLAVYRA